jgi:prefoldin subunit 5
MNNRMKIVEKGFNTMRALEKDVTYLKVSVSEIQDSSKNIKSKIDDVETFCVNLNDTADDLMSSKRRVDSEISSLKAKNQYLENEIHNLRQSNTQLKDLCLRIQSRSIENNLLFFGLDEALPANEDRENPEEVVRTFLKNYIEDNTVVNVECPVNVDNIKFEKVHRIGNPITARRNGRSRPMVVSFSSLHDRNRVRAAGVILNKSQKVFKIYEHFPREIEERRKILYPIAREHGDKGHKVSLVRDQLFVNHELYDIEKAKFISRQKSQTIVSDLRNRSPSRDARPSRRPPSLHERFRDRTRSPSLIRRPQSNSDRPPNQSARAIPNYARRPNTIFETPNRYTRKHGE